MTRLIADAVVLVGDTEVDLLGAEAELLAHAYIAGMTGTLVHSEGLTRVWRLAHEVTP